MRIKGVPKLKFRDRLVEASFGCHIQHTGWPCGTCFITSTIKPSGRDWRAVLAYRGDYDCDIEGDHIKMAVDIVFKDGVLASCIRERTIV